MADTLIELCTIEDVKTRMGIAAEETKHDDLINMLIPTVSVEAARYIGRIVEDTDQTEVFDVDGHTRFQLRGYPVDTITDVRSDLDRTFGSGTIQDSARYYTDNDRGILFVEANLLVDGFQALQVKYNGGISATTAGLLVTTRTFDGVTLREAAMLQIAFMVATKHLIGATSADGGGAGSASYKTPDKWWLPEALSRLKRLKPPIVGAP